MTTVEAYRERRQQRLDDKQSKLIQNYKYRRWNRLDSSGVSVERMVDIVARKDADDTEWITVNGAHIPLDENGDPSGTVGNKITAGSSSQSKLNLTRELSDTAIKSAYSHSGERASMDWFRENREELKEAYGNFKDKQAIDDLEKDFRDIKYGKDFGAKELSAQEATDIIRNRVPENVLSGWYRNADSNYKSKLEDIVLNDDEIRNAAMNVAYRNYKQFSSDDISYNDFLDKEITVYRGKLGEERYVEGDQIMAYSLDKKVAQAFAHGGANGSYADITGDEVLKESTIRPRDTVGCFRDTAEYEYLIRRDEDEDYSEDPSGILFRASRAR